MTDVAPPPHAAAAPLQVRRRRFRRAIVVVMIASLLLSLGARQWAMTIQRRADKENPNFAAGAGAADNRESVSLGSLDSYFLILLLGGLRGPLVMFLWTQVEAQKAERTLNDVDTMIELIGLLQPEFDSVHIFQAWNKAYNISVQVASLATRYAVILDAVRYLERVDRNRPNNINILLSLNQLFQHKLGSTSGDSIFYHRQVREDSKWRPPSDKRQLVGSLEQRMQPLLAQDGTVLPNLVAPQTPRPPTLPAKIVYDPPAVERVRQAAAALGIRLSDSQVATGSGDSYFTVSEAEGRRLESAFEGDLDILVSYGDWNDGSPMQYLKPYEPYLDGVSPLGIGYNYVKRADVLMNRTEQRPAQGSGPTIIDSRPAVELKAWMDSEWDLAVQLESGAFAKATGNNKIERFAATADLPLEQKVTDAGSLTRAQSTFHRARLLARDSRREFFRHLNNNTFGEWRAGRYIAMTEEVRASEAIIWGDEHFAQALAATGDARKKLLSLARESYMDGVSRHRFVQMRFYMPGEVDALIYPPGLNRVELANHVHDHQLIAQLYQSAGTFLKNLEAVDQNADERMASTLLIDRAVRRLATIDKALGTSSPTAAAATAPSTQAATRPSTTPSPVDGPVP